MLINKEIHLYRIQHHTKFFSLLEEQKVVRQQNALAVKSLKDGLLIAGFNPELLDDMYIGVRFDNNISLHLSSLDNVPARFTRSFNGQLKLRLKSALFNYLERRALINPVTVTTSRLLDIRQELNQIRIENRVLPNVFSDFTEFNQDFYFSSNESLDDNSLFEPVTLKDVAYAIILEE